MNEFFRVLELVNMCLQELDRLVEEAVLEANFSKARIHESSEIPGWLLWLKALDEDPAISDDVPVPISGQQPQRQLTRCNRCNIDFHFPFNHYRHLIGHQKGWPKGKMENGLAEILAFWEELEGEEAQAILKEENILSVVKTEEELKTLAVEEIFKSVREIAQSSNPLDPHQIMDKMHKAVETLVEAVDGRSNLSPRALCQALLSLSEGNLLLHPFLPEVERGVCEHANNPENFPALFAVFVEYSVLKAFFDEMYRSVQDIPTSFVEEPNQEQPSIPAIEQRKPSKARRRARRNRGVQLEKRS